MIIYICGDAADKWDDYERFLEFDVAHDVCCINRAGLKFPCDFKFWYSFHSDILAYEWHKGTHPSIPISHNLDKRMLSMQLYNTGGSSSLQAFMVLHRVYGKAKFVFGGAGLEDRYEHFLEYWKQPDIPRNIMRSMSGNTKLLLGEPTKEWLEM